MYQIASFGQGEVLQQEFQELWELTQKKMEAILCLTVANGNLCLMHHSKLGLIVARL